MCVYGLGNVHHIQANSLSTILSNEIKPKREYDLEKSVDSYYVMFTEYMCIDEV